MVNRKNIKALSFGEVLFDVINGQEYLGGASLNFAAHLSRLGAKSHILSCCGNDERGRRANEQIQELGVRSGFLLSEPNLPTGIVDVQLSNGGQPEYDIVTGVAYDNIKYSEPQIADILDCHADAFYFGSLIQRSKTSRDTLYQLLEKFAGSMIFYDVNIRQNYYSKELIENSLRYATAVKLNDQEQELLSDLLFSKELGFDEFYLQFCERYGEKLLIVTKGEKGCSVFSAGGRADIEPIKVKVADAVGAGDAFSAAFVYNYISGKSPKQAAYLANQLGAFVIGKSGAVPDYSPQEVFACL